MYFKVDTSVLEIPDIGDIQHRVTVSLNGTPSGAVVSAPSVDPTPLSPGDEYATLVAAGTPFLAPSAALPEGLRGAYVKITGGSGADEAAGQIRLILESTASSLKLDKPWSVEPNIGGANFEISLFSAVQVPGVRVRIYSADLPEVVVDESEGSTTCVAEGSSAGSATDTIRLKLSAAPISWGTVTVTLSGSWPALVRRGGATPTTVTFNGSRLERLQDDHHLGDQRRGRRGVPQGRPDPHGRDGADTNGVVFLTSSNSPTTTSGRPRDRDRGLD